MRANVCGVTATSPAPPVPVTLPHESSTVRLTVRWYQQCHISLQAIWLSVRISITTCLEKLMIGDAKATPTQYSRITRPMTPCIRAGQPTVYFALTDGPDGTLILLNKNQNTVALDIYSMTQRRTYNVCKDKDSR
ncbi:hypothetical protein CDAR_79731 [Caerostris darwini]|uniref:Uncharacterized protein n=1 Tax=Caerostris darwini TaxID=1538125 RepID=A0AAV4V8H1_9ARAC|nr:hypothetical protein CDAR_79731 [Caerostris darwini]